MRLAAMPTSSRLWSPPAMLAFDPVGWRCPADSPEINSSFDLFKVREPSTARQLIHARARGRSSYYYLTRFEAARYTIEGGQ
jgi:hypothetical protein